MKKMPNMSTTCTVYLTSLKNRLAQLRRSDTAVVKSTSSAIRSGTQTKFASSLTPRNGRTTASESYPIDESNDWAPIDDSGRTSRGK